MSAFSMIESFFFLSLGITFILIILLIYHFKQRITTIEQKSDTMFDIVQNMAKELNSMKVQRPVNELSSERVNYVNAILQQVDESEDESDDESDDDDDDDESDDNDDNDESDEGEASTDFVAKSAPAYEGGVRGASAPANEGGVRGASAPADESIKIININDLEQVDQIQENDDDSDSDNDTSPIELNDDDLDKIKVLKVNASSDIVFNSSPATSDQSIHVYKKMTVGALKSLVISKGLCSDASKFSKRELLKLLTNK